MASLAGPVRIARAPSRRPPPKLAGSVAPHRDDDRKTWRLAIAVMVGAALARLIFAARTPLFPDETYYWEWSRHLAAGYFDHPPAIALLIRAGTTLLGDTSLGVRLFPVMIGAIAIGVTSLSARDLAGDRAALRVAVIFAVMPLAATGLVLATPDVPLLFACAVSVAAVMRAVGAPAGSRNSLRWWLLFGAAIGVALSSKYTAVLIPAGVAAAICTGPSLRHRFREPGPYLAAIVAIALFAPVLVWNANHDWVSLRFQLGHGFGRPAPGAMLPRELSLIGGQILLVSPIIFALAAAVLRRTLARDGDSRRRVLAMITAVTFAFFFFTALRHSVEPNWPSPAYISATMLLAVAPIGGRMRRWSARGCWLALAMTVAIYAHVWHPFLPISPRSDPIARAYGWDETAARLLAAAPRDAWLATDRYQESSELAFNLKGHPTVFSLNLGGRANEYDLWPRFPDRAKHGDALVVLLDDTAADHPVAERLRPHFESMARGDTIALRRGSSVTQLRRIYIMRGWRGTWPQ
ncbi:MAG: glycosyltransferase family 39 protein [Gemmatimonadota bacterium]|nr:glycosyltransferase family 39 protein [Gemmatimonadota bacterium]